MSEIFQRTLKEKFEGDSSWSKIDMVTPDGAYDAVGNLVNVGDSVKIIDEGGFKIDKVVQLEPTHYKGRLGIATANHGWLYFWSILKI